MRLRKRNRGTLLARMQQVQRPEKADAARVKERTDDGRKITRRPTSNKTLFCPFAPAENDRDLRQIARWELRAIISSEASLTWIALSISPDDPNPNRLCSALPKLLRDYTGEVITWRYCNHLPAGLDCSVDPDNSCLRNNANFKFLNRMPPQWWTSGFEANDFSNNSIAWSKSPAEPGLSNRHHHSTVSPRFVRCLEWYGWPSGLMETADFIVAIDWSMSSTDPNLPNSDISKLPRLSRWRASLDYVRVQTILWYQELILRWYIFVGGSTPFTLVDTANTSCASNLRPYIMANYLKTRELRLYEIPKQHAVVARCADKTNVI
jgi:hypothetical protein